MKWYLKRYLKIVLKYRETKGLIGTPEFEQLLIDFYKLEGKNNVRWLLDEDSGNAWFNYIENHNHSHAYDNTYELICCNFEKLLLKELNEFIDK